MAKAPTQTTPAPEPDEPSIEERDTFVRMVRDLQSLDAGYRKHGTSLANVVHELGARTLGLHDGAPAKPAHDPLAKWR
jgi:hypothetical protein